MVRRPSRNSWFGIATLWTSTSNMRSRQPEDRRGKRERTQKVVKSFRSSVTSIVILSSAPSRANAMAAGSERLSASAKSRKLTNPDVRSGGITFCGAATAMTGWATPGSITGVSGAIARRAGRG